jgi:hypothetical protein
MKYLLLFIIFTVSWQVQASRLLEIEDYYSQKTTEFIRARYPRSAFSVYVKVEAEDAPQARELANRKKPDLLNLPYLESVRTKDIGFWDRKDLSLGTLMSYLRSVSVRVDIDRDFSESEADLFQAELFKYLKLSDRYDRIEVKERQWSGQEFWDQWKPYSLFGLAGLCLALLTFFFIFQTGVSRLIKGLAQPLSEIGKSAENVANSAQVSPSATSAMGLSRLGFVDSPMPLQNYDKVKKDIDGLVPFLDEAPANLLRTIEILGTQDPLAMGAIFQEIPTETLQRLVVWAQGDWWRAALTNTSPLSKTSVDFVNELNQVRIRHHLLENKVEPVAEDLRRALLRLEIKEFGQFLKGFSFKQAQPLLALLPQESMIQVGKYLYPGEWAQLLSGKMESPLSSIEAKKQYDRVVKIKPLKTKDEIAQYFHEADLLSFLWRSSTRDEREVYRALPEKSWVLQFRTPFYKVFEPNNPQLETLASNLPLETWAIGLTDCDRQECEVIFKHFTEKQRFLMRSYKQKLHNNPPSVAHKVQVKKQIVKLFDHINQQTQEPAVEESHEAAA